MRANSIMRVTTISKLMDTLKYFSLISIFNVFPHKSFYKITIKEKVGQVSSPSFTLVL